MGGRGVFEAQGTAWPGTGAESESLRKNHAGAVHGQGRPVPHLVADLRVRAQQGCVVTAQVPGSRSRPAKSELLRPETPVYQAPQVIACAEKVCTGLVAEKAKKEGGLGGQGKNLHLD